MAETHEMIEINGLPWRVSLTWAGTRHPAVVSVEIKALRSPDGRRDEVTAALLREVQLGRIIAAHRRQPEAIEAPAPHVGRPRTRDAEHYKAVAETYRTAIEARQRPVQAVADTFGVTPSTARRWVHVARHRHGVLPLVRRGQAG